MLDLSESFSPSVLRPPARLIFSPFPLQLRRRYRYDGAAAFTALIDVPLYSLQILPLSPLLTLWTATPISTLLATTEACIMCKP